MKIPACLPRAGVDFAGLHILGEAFEKTVNILVLEDWGVNKANGLNGYGQRSF